MTLFIYQYITIKDHVSYRNENFHQRNFRGCNLITLEWLGHVNCRSGTHSFWLVCILNKFGVCMISDHVVTGLRPATLLKKRLWYRCFPVNFAKFITTPFLQNTSGLLLLYLHLLLLTLRNLFLYLKTKSFSLTSLNIPFYFENWCRLSPKFYTCLYSNHLHV